MKIRFLILAFFIKSFLLLAQDAEREKKLKLISENIPFPEVYVNFKIGFSAEMLDISKLPSKNKYKELSISDL